MASAPAVPDRGRLPTRTKDRRGALGALALLLVVAGALGAALVAYRSGQRTDVLVASHTIKIGSRVSSSDFTTVRVAADSGSVVRAADESNFLGAYATTDIPSGTLVNRLMFQAGSMIPSDGVVVGVPLGNSQRPADQVQVGDVVRVFAVPKSQTAAAPQAATSVLIDAARVVSVSSSTTSGSTAVSLLLTGDDAQVLATALTADTISVGELPRTVKPKIDFQKQS